MTPEDPATPPVVLAYPPPQRGRHGDAGGLVPLASPVAFWPLPQ